MEKENGYMQRCMDYKKLWLLYRKKAWLVIAVALFVALLVAGCYKVVTELTKGEQLYVVSSDYYITFNEKDHPEGVHYYNAFTWDSVLRDDPVVDEVLLCLPDDYTKEEIKAGISGEMLSDYRILTVYSKNAVPERAEAIADASADGLKRFGDKLDLFESIEQWSKEECVPAKEPDLTANAAVIGGIIGLLMGFFVYAAMYVLDDSIYMESDFTQRFTQPFLGAITKNGSEYSVQELKENLSYLLKEESGYYIVFASVDVDVPKGTKNGKKELLLNEIKQYCNKVEGILDLSGKDLEILRKSNGAILMLPWGRKNGKIVEKTIAFMEKQDCNLSGVVLYDADDTFMKKYYNVKNL